MSNSETILHALMSAGNALDSEALADVIHFIQSKCHPQGGFTDRAGNADPYYSMFGYSLCLALNIKLDLSVHYDFLEQYIKDKTLDFVHAASIIRCHMLLGAIKEQQRLGSISKLLGSSNLLMNLWKKKLGKKLQKSLKSCFDVIDEHRSADGGYNHDTAHAEHCTSYASFIIWSLFNDLGLSNSSIIASAVQNLKCNDGSYSNIADSQTGITTATSAAVIIQKETNEAIDTASISWLKSQQTDHGGLTAAAGIPLPDMLSTATGLLALACVDSIDSETSVKNIECTDLHWDESGGFFGSAADQIPDIEYTYYALLTLGLCA